MHYFSCPHCGRKAAPKHYVSRAEKVSVWYGCLNDHCRCHWQMLYQEGQDPVIVAQSARNMLGRKPLGGDVRREPAVPGLMADGMFAKMGCPDCGRYGPIKVTFPQRSDGRWRKHKCPSHGAYFTCQSADGVRVTRKVTSLKAVELETTG
jgi:hypothetical protein